MSSHSSNNSNADMEVINAEDLEDSPPPGDAEDVTALEEMNNAPESKEEEAVEATASGDTEQIGEIVDVDEVNVNKSVDEEVAEGKVDDDDDPPIEILEAPTPPLAEESVPAEASVEVVPVVEVAPVVKVAPVVDAQETKEEDVVEATASGDTEQIGEIGEEDEAEEVDAGKEEEEDDDPPIEILEAPTPPLAEESVPEPNDEVVPAVEVAPCVEVASVVAAAVAADPTPTAALVETQAPTSAAAPAAVEEDDDDPCIEILEAPTPPLAQESVPEPNMEVAPAVEVAPEVTAVDPKPAAAIVETTAPTPAAASAPAPAASPAPAPQPQVVSVRPSVTAERPAATLEEVDNEEDDDDIDETLAERLVGLTEMFPDFVRNGSVSLVRGSWSLTQSCYSLGRAASWVVFSSATILFMPIMIESERLQLQDQMKAQKNQILLGPGAAVSGGPSLGPPPI